MTAARARTDSQGPVPAGAGIGLRHPYVDALLADPRTAGWIEVHSENYLCAGGPRLKSLERLRAELPLSCHGVGLSLGSADGLDDAHLRRLRALFDRFEPGLVSEHVSWSVTDATYLNDLLPLPYTGEALDVLCRNIDRAQEAFGRRILIENPSSYLSFAPSEMSEWTFIAEAVARTGCGLLLDVNNIHVSAHNHGFDAADYLAGIPADAVEEIHVAGHADCASGGERVLIDDHGHPVIEPVWALLDDALEVLGPVPVLLERDMNFPPLDDLLAETRRAQRALDRCADAVAPLGHVA
jgi:uncharacterized protein (UPF0276 family)